MPAFIDKLKALKRPKKGAAAAAVAAPISPPIFLMVGSVSGVSRKDATAYARGLAEANVISPVLGRIHVLEDKARNRWVYEVHEGGGEFSIAEKVLARLDAGERVLIELANNYYLSVEDTGGEIFSLVHQPSADPLAAAAVGAPGPVQASLPGLDDQGIAALSAELGEPVEVVRAPAVADAETTEAAPVIERPVSVSVYEGKSRLEELFPENKALSKFSFVLVGVSSALFITLGLLYTVLQAGVFDKDAMFTLTKAGHLADASDNPVWQLGKARNEADKTGNHIKALKRGPNGTWTWELAQ